MTPFTCFTYLRSLAPKICSQNVYVDQISANAKCIYYTPLSISLIGYYDYTFTALRDICSQNVY